MKISNAKVIYLEDWDKCVKDTYKRPYCLQQQAGCMSRGVIPLTVPEGSKEDYDYPNDNVPEIVNHTKRGVSLEAWLTRDPDQKLPNPDQQHPFSLGLWWERNFYPNMQMVANDLHSKGILEAGEYIIIMD